MKENGTSHGEIAPCLVINLHGASCPHTVEFKRLTLLGIWRGVMRRRRLTLLRHFMHVIFTLLKTPLNDETYTKLSFHSQLQTYKHKTSPLLDRLSSIQGGTYGTS